MDQEKYQTTFLLAFLILICALLLASPSPVTHAGPGLPPRRTPTPTRPPGGNNDGKPAGAHIILQVQSAPVEVWTVVQWQDSAGSWHDIEGWSGALDEGDQKVWWVAPKDFGTGPFRWLVYQGQGGKLLAQSELFYLSYSAGETARIEVSLVLSQPTQRSTSILTLPYPSSDGSYIELHVYPPQSGLWTIVQWQDSAGGWHDIEGWQGTLNEDHKKVWWVAPDIFGKGPFRWTVYQSEKGRLLATSDSFYLPNSAGKKVQVGMTLSQ
ncbi:MAG: hypothetical protein E3J21_24015 [Anaerolineales bacterium]|nr:MAG: hypothetical protein E3J21_24015 [Anaerolineales bacterium]